MMGPTHAASGALAGIGAAMALSHYGIADITAPEALVMSGISAGAALVPDLDHPSATIARTFGPVTKAAAIATNKLSATWQRVTGGPRDDRSPGGHRGMTHTLFGVVLTSLVILGSVHLWGTTAALAIFFLFTTFAMHSLFRPLTRRLGGLTGVVTAGAITYLCYVSMPATVSAPALMVAAVVGGIAHIIGDAVTYSGVPNPLAPLVSHNGKRWDSVHLLPKPLRFSASGPMDTVLFAVICLATIYLVWQSMVYPVRVGVDWAPLSHYVSNTLG